jgi:hypothetical protein
MGRIAYTNQQKAEAVALAVVVGVEHAADQLRIDRRTVRGWLEQAGKAPELAAPATGWEQLLALAQAKVAAALASGKVTPIQAATIAGISARNIRDRPPDEPAPTDVERHVDGVMARLDELYRPDGADIALSAIIEETDRVIAALDAGAEPESDEPFDELAFVASLIEHHGSLQEWRKWEMADDHRRTEEQLEANRLARIKSTTPRLDDETRALVAAAEAELAGEETW